MGPSQGSLCAQTRTQILNVTGEYANIYFPAVTFLDSVHKVTENTF